MVLAVLACVVQPARLRNMAKPSTSSHAQHLEAGRVLLKTERALRDDRPLCVRLDSEARVSSSRSIARRALSRGGQ